MAYIPHNLRNRRALSFIVIIIIFGVVGTWKLIDLHAATPAVSVEVESGTVSSAATPVSDSSASNGNAVKFGQSSATTASCIGTNNAPGSPDPWGGCWPGPQNTGYPHGLAGDTRTPVTLTMYTGPSTITSCGTVIDSKIVPDGLNITASNGTHSPDTPCVIIKNSLVQDEIHEGTTDDQAVHGPVVITDTEISLPTTEIEAATGFFNTFDTRLNVHGSGATIKCEAYCISKDAWVHDFYLTAKAPSGTTLARHYNAFGGNGVFFDDGYVDIEHAYASCNFSGSSPADPSDPSLDISACAGDISFYGDYAEVHNVTVNKTYLHGSTANAYQDHDAPFCLRMGANSGGKPFQNPNHNTVTNNIFGLGRNNTCGVSGGGPAYPYAATANGNIWSNNKYENGTIIPPPTP